MTQEILISVRGLGLTYKVRRSLFSPIFVPALSEVSFDVYKGETLGVVGKNGSGKSTLLRALAGIYKPDQGLVRFDATTIALMTLSLGFDPVMSGRDNAIFGGMLLGFDSEYVESQLDEIKAFSGIGDAFEAPVRTYSSGMLSRLSFAVAMKVSPDVMLLDELLAVGDESFRAKAYEAMREKIASDQTTIFVSHNVDEILALCDRAILLHEGRIISQGDPKNIISRYRKLD